MGRLALGRSCASRSSHCTLQRAQLDDDTIRRQQAAYSVAGVDEEAPAFDPKEKKAKKRSRKAAEEPANAKPAARNTAIFISNLPDDPPPTVEELASTFNRAGLILEGVDGLPKVKVYSGESAGKALVVYLKEESVELALTLFDGAPLRIGGKGALRVEQASFEHKKPVEEPTADASLPPSKRPKQDDKRARQGKKADKLRSRLENWSSDEDAPDGPRATTSVTGKNARVVVLAHMFTLAELESDPTLLLDLKEDVRDECEQTCGKVNSIQLYDVRRESWVGLTAQLEANGIMTVKFAEAVAAKACVLVRLPGID